MNACGNVVSVKQQETSWRKIGSNKILVGFFLSCNPVTNQMLDFYDEMRIYGQTECILLVRNEEYEANSDWFKKTCSGRVLVTYTPEDSEILALLKIMMLPESNYDVFSDIPKNVTKIGCPHGIDIPLEKTMLTYGGGFCFDYILSAKKADERDSVKCKGKFPASMRFHSNSSIGIIPFGVPKLDKFLNKVTEYNKCRQKKAIIYHISLLGLEEKWVENELFPTLRVLLEQFSEYRIVFRPHHFDRTNPTILQCVEYGQKYKQFKYSESDSYIEDYAQGCVMIIHRAYEQHLFSLATGRPIILYQPDADCSQQDDEDVIMCNRSTFAKKLSDVLSSTQEVPGETRIKQCRALGIYNPGNAVSSLMGNIHYILENKKHPDWIYYDLDSACRIEPRAAVILNLLSEKPCNMFMVALAKAYPDMPQFYLFAADSYSRTRHLHTYYYQHSLEYVYLFLKRTEVSKTYKELFQLWWKRRGIHVLQHVLNDVQSNEPYSLAVKWLQERYSSDKSHLTVLFQKAFVIKRRLVEFFKKRSKIKFFDINTGKALVDGAEMCIYGYGEVTSWFIEQNEKKHQFVIQGNINADMRRGDFPRVGESSCGFDTISKNVKIIAICEPYILLSQGYELISKLQKNQSIYALCQDRLVENMINIIPYSLR